MRILIGTNLWVRALISQETRDRLQVIISSPEIEIVGNQQLIEEIRDVAARPQLKKFLKTTDVEAYIQLLLNRLEIVAASSQIQICRDPDDDFLLALCKDFGVNFLLTEDEDLLVLDPFEQTRIVRLFEFEKELGD